MQRQEPLEIDPETILTVHLLTFDSRSEQERERVSNAMHGHKVSIYHNWNENEASTFLCLRAASISLSSWNENCLHFQVTIALLEVFSIRSCPWDKRTARSFECLSLWNSFIPARRPPLTLHHSQSLCFWWSIRPRCRHWANAQDHKSE